MTSELLNFSTHKVQIWHGPLVWHAACLADKCEYKFPFAVELWPNVVNNAARHAHRMERSAQAVQMPQEDTNVCWYNDCTNTPWYIAMWPSVDVWYFTCVDHADVVADAFLERYGHVAMTTYEPFWTHPNAQ